MARGLYLQNWFQVMLLYSRTEHAFAAKKADGSVVAWGDACGGGDFKVVAAKLESVVDVVFSTNSAFAAKKLDGSVITWSPGGGAIRAQ